MMLIGQRLVNHKLSSNERAESLASVTSKPHFSHLVSKHQNGDNENVEREASNRTLVTNEWHHMFTYLQFFLIRAEKPMVG